MTSLDEAVDLLKDMVPLVIDDDDSLCDTLAAAVSGCNGAFSTLQLVHRLIKVGVLPNSKAGCALRVQQRASGHVPASSGQVASPRASQEASPRAVVVSPSCASATPLAAPGLAQRICRLRRHSLRRWGGRRCGRWW